MNDLKPFKHGQEGTHYACKDMIGGGCCACNKHDCETPTHSPQPATASEEDKPDEDWPDYSRCRYMGEETLHDQNCEDCTPTPLQRDGEDGEWALDFDRLFTRQSRDPAEEGRYRDDWFVKDDVTSREIKDFIRIVLQADRAARKKSL